MPILIMRAKSGAGGVVSNTTDASLQEQYDLNQVIGYTGKSIGVGKEAPGDDEFDPPVPARRDDEGEAQARPSDRHDRHRDRRPGAEQPGCTATRTTCRGFMRHPSMPSVAAAEGRVHPHQLRHRPDLRDGR